MLAINNTMSHSKMYQYFSGRKFLKLLNVKLSYITNYVTIFLFCTYRSHRTIIASQYCFYFDIYHRTHENTCKKRKICKEYAT
jgi:hypothetical protein